MKKHQEQEKGTIVSVNVSAEKGQKKHNIGRCLLVKALGIEGDAHAGMEIRQVSLLAKESIEKIQEKGLDVRFGDFAENFPTEGIILHELPIGTRFKVGVTVELRLTQIGKICPTIAPSMPRLATVLCPGKGSLPKS
jgi:MOSC domain-containing protein YiiM